MNVNNLRGINARMQLRLGNNGINNEMQRRFADLMRLGNSSWQPTAPQGSYRILKKEESFTPFFEDVTWPEKIYDRPGMLGSATGREVTRTSFYRSIIQGIGSIPLPEKYTF